VDLGDLEAVAAEREVAWRSAGVAWQVIRGPETDKPAAWLQIARGAAAGELILWASGEAEVSYVPAGSSEPVCVHQELSSAAQLAACVDDLVRQVGPG
jgi:hypothetical protein